ncbi:MAG: geranylgeranylglycerol-phosphate geranylgeranyltransferase [Candidatus Heimdallarchaeota archaeon]|nr:MAG: geranylgeranylglycerol-phosphate geranylgeranyltransferase [Candidatus Heimdallarchaeota archaeon]
MDEKRKFWKVPRPLFALFLISRPLNSFLSGFAVVIGAIAAISESQLPLSQSQLIGIVLGYFATSLIAIGGYTINDVFDIEIDKINAPHRPLPSGLMTIGQAKGFSIVLFMIGVATPLLNIYENYVINLQASFIALVGGLLLYLYAIYFKRSGFTGNVMIGVLTAIPFIYGGFLTKSFKTMIFPVLFSFLIIVGREVIKDIEDVHGDQIKDVQSIALKYGVKPARNIGFLILLLLIIVDPLPIILSYYINPVFILIILTIDAIIIYCGYLCFNRSEEEIIKNSTLSKKMLKGCITLGVVGFLIEGVVKLISFYM